MERRSQRAEEAPRRESGRRDSPLASRIRGEGETGETGGGAACEAGQRRCGLRCPWRAERIWRQKGASGMAWRDQRCGTPHHGPAPTAPLFFTLGRANERGR